MARKLALGTEVVAKVLRAAGPAGLGPEALEDMLPEVSRSTLGRRLAELTATGAIKAIGRGRAIRYVTVAAYGIEDVRRYFQTDWQSRPSVGFQEDQLLPAPGPDPEIAKRLVNIQALARSLDRRFLAEFLIDFSWASSVLEGSTYSSIDTQALIEYGERNEDKPFEDALLILNHKNAIQFLWNNRDLTVDNLCKLQAFLTDGHGRAESQDSDHFLPESQRGVVREFEDVRLGRSAYSPPFRPGTGYIAEAFNRLVETAKRQPPVEAAFYLMSRIPYLQAFANGNKRTARLAANLPLLAARLLPLSFVDFKKADYVLGMAAFYELGDTQVLQRVFIEGYVRSIIRGSNLPAAFRLTGFKLDDVVQELQKYVYTGHVSSPPVERFLNTR